MRHTVRTVFSVTVAFGLALTAGISEAETNTASVQTADVMSSEVDTCAFARSGRRLGCVSDASNENILFSRQGRWVFLHNAYAPKEIELPAPEAAAERLRPGVWRVVEWPSRRVLGLAVAINAEKTRWRITNRSRRLIATGRGPDGPRIGMLVLTGWFG
jgi:hypothetical protein